MTTADLATFCSVVGVVVALAGVAIASPDGTALIWHNIRSSLRWLRGKLARILPFLRASASVHAGAAMATAHLGAAGRGRVWRPWEPDADDARKIEILRRQVELLDQEIENIWTRLDERFSELRSELQEVEARLSAANADLAKALEVRERRAARVDARGLWPIWFGIILTALPNELASVPVLGWIVPAAAVGITARLALKVARDWHTSLPTQ